MGKQQRCTVFGAIGPSLDQGRVMRIGRSTNKEEFKAFLVAVY